MSDSPRVGIAMLIVCASIAGCGDEDASAALDARVDVDSGGAVDAGCREPEIGCPCADRIGEVICRSPGPDLYCSSGTWGPSADGPCPGLDGGAGSDGGMLGDGSTDADAAITDAAISTDAAVADAATATDAAADAGGTTDAGTPAMATYCVDIDVSNTCAMSVTPPEITIPAGQTAYFCWRNRSSDYAVDVWLSYGGGYTDLAPGATWNEPVGHCLGPTARTEYADISTACSEHRFLIRCL
ncbi:MAG: hypothetical protein M3Y87_04195 [Myxococcota bacterium]|nr:hypothetical protein [Myxococcota bacterium]